MKASLYFLLSVFLLSLVWAGSLAGAPQPDKAPDGEEVYKANCTRCHNTPPALNQRQARDGATHSLVIRALRDRGWDLRLYDGTHDHDVKAPETPAEYLVECTVEG